MISEEERALEVIQGQLKPENEFLRMTQGQQVSVSLVPEQNIQQAFPGAARQFMITVDPKTKVQQVKEQLCGSLGSLDPSQIVLRGTKLNLPLKDQCTLAFFNIGSGGQLYYSIREQ